MKNLNVYYILLFILMFLVISPLSYASCNSSGIISSVIATTTLTVPRDRGVGPIGSVITLPSGVATYVYCTPGVVSMMLKLGSTMTESVIPGVYDTNVPGIGIKVWNTFSGSVDIGNNLSYWYSPSSSAHVGYSAGAVIVAVNIQFYVTGPVSFGTVNFPDPFVESWANTEVSLNGATRYNALRITPVIVSSGACETPDISVKLGEHFGYEFSGTGSKSSVKKFDFKLNSCATGMSAVSYRFEPATGVNVIGTGNDQYLTLDSTSTAKGVGIQVLYDNESNIPFGTKIKYTGYVGAGNYTIPMKARYIMTGPIIVPGSANSALEFTMTYE